MLPSDPDWHDIDRGELVAADMKSNPACQEFAEKSGIDMETISGAAVHDAMVALGQLGGSGGVLVPVQENVGGPLSAAGPSVQEDIGVALAQVGERDANPMWATQFAADVPCFFLDNFGLI